MDDLTLSLVLEGLILIAILSVLTGEDYVSDDDGGYGLAGVIAVGTGLLSWQLTLALETYLPHWLAQSMALAVAGTLLTFAIRYFFGLILVRAAIGAVVYFVLSLVVRLLLMNVMAQLEAV